MDLAAEIRRLFPTGIYGQKCTEADLNEAERLIGLKLPNSLYQLYLSFNGLQIPRSWLRIYPLLPKHAQTSTVSMTLFWRNDPYIPVKEDIVFYGMSCKQLSWGIKLTEPHVVVEYGPDLNEPAVIGNSVLDAFRENKQWYVENVNSSVPWEQRD